MFQTGFDSQIGTNESQFIDASSNALSQSNVMYESCRMPNGCD